MAVLSFLEDLTVCITVRVRVTALSEQGAVQGTCSLRRKLGHGWPLVQLMFRSVTARWHMRGQRRHCYWQGPSGFGRTAQEDSQAPYRPTGGRQAGESEAMPVTPLRLGKQF